MYVNKISYVLKENPKGLQNLSSKVPNQRNGKRRRYRVKAIKRNSPCVKVIKRNGPCVTTFFFLLMIRPSTLLGV